MMCYEQVIIIEKQPQTSTLYWNIYKLKWRQNNCSYTMQKVFCGKQNLIELKDWFQPHRLMKIKLTLHWYKQAIYRVSKHDILMSCIYILSVFYLLVFYFLAERSWRYMYAIKSLLNCLSFTTIMKHC